MQRENALKIWSISAIILELISLLFLPAQIPVHYSMNLQDIVYGSKYMILIIGVITIFLGVFLSLIYKAYRKTETEKLVYRLGMLALIVFNFINVLSIFGAFAFS